MHVCGISCSIEMAIRSFDHIIKGFKGSVTTTNCFLRNFQQSGLGFFGSPHKSLRSFSFCLHGDDDHHDHDHPNLDDVLNMFNGMTQTRPLPSVCKFNQLLDTVTNMNHYPCSIRLFKQMCAVGAPVDERTADIVVRCYSGMNDTEQGFTVLGYCFKQGIVPDVSAYNTLLNGFIVQHRTHDAETLFKKLFNNSNNQLSCEPNTVTYNTMIKGLSKIGNHFAAVGLLRLMIHGRSAGDCKPDKDTYNPIIDGMCQDVTMIDDAFRLYNEMPRQHILPDVATHNSLFYALCMLARWDDVYRLLKKFTEKRMHPNAKTFDILADARHKQHKLDSRYILDVMIRCGFNTDTDVDRRSREGAYMKKNKLVAGNSKYEMVDEAMNMYRLKIETTNCDFFINNTRSQRYADCDCFTARVTLQAKRPLDKQSSELCYLSKHKSLDGHRRDYYEVVDFLNLFPHTDFYGMVIDFASSIGKFDVSRCLFQDLFAKGLSRPTVKTYGVMIRGFCRRGLLKDAKRLFLKMETRGCQPDILIINDLIQGYLENKPLDDVISFFKELNGRGYTVSETISDPNVMKVIDQFRFKAKNIPEDMFKFIRECMPEEYKYVFEERPDCLYSDDEQLPEDQWRDTGDSMNECLPTDCDSDSDSMNECLPTDSDSDRDRDNDFWNYMPKKLSDSRLTSDSDSDSDDPMKLFNQQVPWLMWIAIKWERERSS